MYITEYIIHQHNAIRAGKHYDLRIKYKNKNALASFALPKAKFPSVGERLLVVRTPDHGVSWLGPHAPIPEGNYGAGTFDVVQSGDMMVYGWSNKLITFSIKGKKINGKFTIVKTNYGKKRGRGMSGDYWLLIRNKDTLAESIILDILGR